jgi:hypothetical protein
LIPLPDYSALFASYSAIMNGTQTTAKKDDESNVENEYIISLQSLNSSSAQYNFSDFYRNGVNFNLLFDTVLHFCANKMICVLYDRLIRNTAIINHAIELVSYIFYACFVFFTNFISHLNIKGLMVDHRENECSLQLTLGRSSILITVDSNSGLFLLDSTLLGVVGGNPFAAYY